MYFFHKCRNLKAIAHTIDNGDRLLKKYKKPIIKYEELQHSRKIDLMENQNAIEEFKSSYIKEHPEASPQKINAKSFRLLD